MFCMQIVCINLGMYYACHFPVSHCLVLYSLVLSLYQMNAVLTLLALLHI